MSYFPDNNVRWGSFPSQDFDSYIVALNDAGLIVRTDLSREMLYTNHFVAGFNGFNPEEVRRHARDYAARQSSSPK